MDGGSSGAIPVVVIVSTEEQIYQIRLVTVSKYFE